MRQQCATVNIKLDDIDRMNDLLREVFALTYLSNLVLENIDDNILCNNELSDMDRFVPMYLLEKQSEIVSQLHELIHSPDFYNRKTV